jgi:hypothetical protein
MSLSSFFKRLKRRRLRKPTTRQVNFRDYNSGRPQKRKPFTPKKTKITPIDRAGRKTAKNKSRILTILKILLGIIIAALLIYLLFFTRLFEIQKVDVQGDENTLEEQAAINLYLQDYLGKNMLLFPSSTHEMTLLDEYSYLKDLHINRRPFHTLVATLVTYDHIANIQVTSENGSSQYFIANELGSIASVGITDQALPTIVMDVTGTDLDLPESQESLAVNQEIIPQETLETLLDSKVAFEGKFDMQILETHYLKQARELHFLTERYFFVWIDLTQSVEIQLAKLKKAMTQLNIYEANLEYVDLRISGQNGEKVIYKLSSSVE